MQGAPGGEVALGRPDRERAAVDPLEQGLLGGRRGKSEAGRAPVLIDARPDDDRVDAIARFARRLAMQDQVADSGACGLLRVQRGKQCAHGGFVENRNGFAGSDELWIGCARSAVTNIKDRVEIRDDTSDRTDVAGSDAPGGQLRVSGAHEMCLQICWT